MVVLESKDIRNPVREVNEAFRRERSVYLNYQWYPESEIERARVVGARTRKGALQFHALSDGKWIGPFHWYNLEVGG